MEFARGEKFGYQWLTTEMPLGDFLAGCPQIVLGKRVTLITVDGGDPKLSEAEAARGCVSEGGMLYIPTVQSLVELPPQRPNPYCDRVYEWFVEPLPARLGNIAQGNVFEVPKAPGTVFRFVCFCGWSLNAGDYQDISDCFWQQMSWVQPESYVAEGDIGLTFATKELSLFELSSATVRDRS